MNVPPSWLVPPPRDAAVSVPPVIDAGAAGFVPSAVYWTFATQVSLSPPLPVPVPISVLPVGFAAVPIPFTVYVGEIAAAATPVTSKAAAARPAATADRTALRIVTPLSLSGE